MMQHVQQFPITIFSQLRSYESAPEGRGQSAEGGESAASLRLVRGEATAL
jgi:hypothetical protein